MVSKSDYFFKTVMNLSFRLFLFFLLPISLSSCAYNWGFGERTLPGGYKELAVPMFENFSPEVGLEENFTSALIESFQQSRAALIQSKGRAPLLLKGRVSAVDITRGLGASRTGSLPSRAVLSTGYLLTVRASLELIRQSDQKVIWSGDFSKSKTYLAPRIGTPLVNSANALYNDSKKKETLRELAKEMMSEAHDRMTEGF